CRIVLPYYGIPHQQEERQQTLLLRRRERPCRRQAAHRSADVFGNSRPVGRSLEGAYRSGSPVGHNPRVRTSRSIVVSRTAFWSLGSAESDVARTAIGPLDSALSVAGGDPSSLSVWLEDRSRRLVSVQHSATLMGIVCPAFS